MEQKQETGKPTTVDNSILLSVIDRKNKWKVSKNTEVLNNTNSQLDLIDIYGTSH